MTHFSKSGRKIFASKQSVDTPVTKLPAMVYSANFSPDLGYYLEEVQSKFELPAKTFGDFDTRADKIVSTYTDRTSSTGVMLTGFKGSGKTVMCNNLSNKMIDSGIPVITINSAMSGQGFNDFIDSLGETVLFFDEFGKVYDDKEGRQDKLLTLFDGQSSVKRLIIVTENKEGLINDFMFDRPGRFFYHFRYSGVNEATVIEFAKYYELSEAQIAQLIAVTRTITELSFDMLGAIVQEAKRYGTPISEVIIDLNISTSDYSSEELQAIKIVSKSTDREYIAIGDNPDYDRDSYFNVKLKTTEDEDILITQIKNIEDSDKTREQREQIRDLLQITSANCYSSKIVNISDDTIIFDDGEFIIVAKVVKKTYDYSKFNKFM